MSRLGSKYNKRDANEGPILKALARMGVEWIEAGPLDGWVFLAGRFIPCEIKTDAGQFTRGQRWFIENCEVYDRPFMVWRSVEEAVKSVKEWRAK